MKVNQVKCVAADVRTESGVCVGIAKIKQGEEFIIDGRTPPTPGMCSNAFCALSNSAFIMMATDSSPGEKDGSIDRVCPHGVVTFSLTRSNTGKAEPYVQN
jgi:uncharacterized repeat protein (TIGR04076 family)